MAREIHRLNARSVATLTKTGRHADGGGLNLAISKNGGRRWTFLYTWRGRPVEIGLGSARKGYVTLAKARELAAQARAMLADGVDPKAARRPAAGSTFGEVADRYIEVHRSEWRSAKHAAQWQTTMEHYAAPLRRLPVADVDVDAVLSVLRPLWSARPETASRVRCRIERILDAARAQGLRTGDNPADGAGIWNTH